MSLKELKQQIPLNVGDKKRKSPKSPEKGGRVLRTMRSQCGMRRLTAPKKTLERGLQTPEGTRPSSPGRRKTFSDIQGLRILSPVT